MKRVVLFLILLLALVLGVGFLLLIWLGMRNNIPHPQTQPQSGRRGEKEHRVPPRPGTGSQSTPEKSCSNLGVSCSSQYFATWSWPADGSCHATLRNGYPEPDLRCTPGGVDPTVTADILRDPAWRTKCIRNCQSSSAQKRAAYEWYGLPEPQGNSGENQVCELDHLVPLELGGADGMGNIWPECGPDSVTLRRRYFKQKDIVENYLAAKVREGKIPLAEAQRGIASDWVQYLDQAKASCRGPRCMDADD